MYEVDRLKRDGLPPIPRPMPTEVGPPEANGKPARHNNFELAVRASLEVVSAQDQVEITRAILEKRRFERELEEAENWFRQRQFQQEAAALVERQKREAILAEQWRRRWMQEWMTYALDRAPCSARGKVEIQVHAEVEAVLSKLPTFEPEAIARPLVDAAVERALQPWQQEQDIKSAIDTAVRKLPWDVRNRTEYASLMQVRRKVRRTARRAWHDLAFIQELQSLFNPWMVAKG